MTLTTHLTSLLLIETTFLSKSSMPVIRVLEEITWVGRILILKDPELFWGDMLGCVVHSQPVGCPYFRPFILILTFGTLSGHV